MYPNDPSRTDFAIVPWLVVALLAAAVLYFAIVGVRSWLITPAVGQDWSAKVEKGPPAGPDLAAARAKVARSLRDPGSAKFGRVWVGRNGAACGTVSARNPMGGMSGQQPWVIPAGKGLVVGRVRLEQGTLVVDEAEQPGGFLEAWNTHCAGTAMR